MALTRLGSLAATNLVLGGNVGTEGDAYKNYNDYRPNKNTVILTILTLH